MPEHDDQHVRGELATAAALYAFPDRIRAWNDLLARFWPWGDAFWKPKSRRENLVRAGALIAAEIDRLDRLENPPSFGIAAPASTPPSTGDET